MPKSKLDAGISVTDGKYPFYLSGDKKGKLNSYQLEGCFIIANDGGEAGFRLSSGKFSYSDHCICFKANEDYITRNLYEYLDSIKKRVTYAGFVGSGLKNIDRDYLRNLKIPNSINSKAISRLFELINGMIDNLNSLSLIHI